MAMPAAAMAGCAHGPTAPPTASTPPQWHPFTLPGKRETRYLPAQKEGRACWHAQADASASMLRRQFEGRPIDGLHAEFSWWVPRTISEADLGRAESSDSPARVAFAFAGDMSRLSARTRMQFQMAEMLTGELPPYATLMYVWSNHAPLETVFTSARTDRVRKIVVESGESHLRRWRSYRRDLSADFHRAFGERPGPLVGIGLMTDADNTGSTAEAWYGDVLLRPAG
jgi:hypothetical protein